MWPRPVGFWSAVQFLTRIPAPQHESRLDGALVWFPVVGLLLGAVLVGLDGAFRWAALPSLLSSVLLVVALLALTGGLHADGLMDTCDAVFVHATPERRLEIMRDPHAGSFAVVGLVAVVALKVAALDALTGSQRTAALVLAPTLGRWAIVLLAGLFPYGRVVGLGSGLKASATRPKIVLATLLPLGAGVLLWPMGVVLGVLAAVTAVVLGMWLMRLLPGLTGDCYGAGCELTETVVLVAAVALAYALA